MIPIDPLRDTQLLQKSYAYFRGCDFTTEPPEIDDSRSPDSLNMLADDAGFPIKRVGWRELAKVSSSPVYGLFYANLKDMGAPCIIVHAGDQLIACKDYGDNDYFSKHDEIGGTKIKDYHNVYGDSEVAAVKSSAFAHKGKLYVLDGQKMTVVSYVDQPGNAWFQNITAEKLSDAEPKVPNTGRGGHYEAEDDGHGNITYTWISCTLNEEPNILSSSQTNLMAGDGVNKDFWLTEHGATVTKVEVYTSGAWAEVSAYTVAEDPDKAKTKITFTSAPAAHQDGAGIDNIRVTFTSTEHPAEPGLINHCTICTQYGYFNDNRFFVSGNPDYPNRDWSSGVDDPTYWPIHGWTDIGSDQTAIMGYLHYGDVLAIIKQDDNQDAEIYIRSATVQSDNTVIMPVQQGVKGVGAISRGCFASLRDDALFYAREGVFAVAGTDASQMRTVQNRSFFVDNRMREEQHKEQATAIAWNNRYLICFPDSKHCYVADARMQSSFNESFVYEWFYWDNIPASMFLEFDGKLFFGTANGQVCRMNDDMLSMVKYSDELVRVDGADPTVEHQAWKNGKRIKAKWTTKADTFGTIARVKTLTKRGCTVMLKPYARSSVKISVITHNVKDLALNEVEMNVWDFADLDFSRIDFNAMATPQVVPIGKKVKKFQQLQLVLENDGVEECFGIYGIQVQYTVNNYIK